jgi:hypothetical protein
LVAAALDLGAARLHSQVAAQEQEAQEHQAPAQMAAQHSSHLNPIQEQQ